MALPDATGDGTHQVVDTLAWQITLQFHQSEE